MTLLCLLSPAKRMEYRRPMPFVGEATTPRFALEAARIARAFKTLTPSQLERLMGISPTLAARAHAHYQNFSDKPEHETQPVGTRPALFAFHGDTYLGLNAYAWEDASIVRAQQRLRIFSGLYGLLRPLDAIKPYRCEMGLPLARLVSGDMPALTEAFEGAPSPARWWHERVGSALVEDIERIGARALVNLASKEYIGVLSPASLPVPLIEVVFAEERNSVERRLGMAEKRMRGACAKYIVENDAQSVEQLEAFGESEEACGYRLKSFEDGVLRFVKKAVNREYAAA